MGLINLVRQKTSAHSTKHLLTTPQHRAFRTLISAEAQRHISRLNFSDLFNKQEFLVTDLRDKLAAITAPMGVKLNQLEITNISAVDDELMRDLGCDKTEAVRAQAEMARLQTTEQTEKLRLATKRKLEQLEESDQGDRLEHERTLRRRRQAIDAELELEAEREQDGLSMARQARHDRELEARLDVRRREAELERDVIAMKVQADEAMSSEVRHHQLQRQALEQFTAAFSRLPLKEIKWVSLEDSSPLGGIMGMFQGLKETLQALPASPQHAPAANSEPHAILPEEG